ncbi:hypothetical protein SO802_015842 [Lithocarpus litseifolius]|uniref:Tr-type G domain-containing protein n=1 Tax=Lithocarpus litseifolius TaxID=425828 RepID=A0AAW2D053_9ROSI
MHLLGELRRNRRSKLKKKCYPEDESKEDVIEKKSGWVNKLQYKELVNYWFLDTSQAKETGQAMEREIVFTKVYCHADGQPVTPEVGEKISEQRHKDELVEALALQKLQLDVQHKEQLAEVKRQLEAQHKEQKEEMMSHVKEMDFSIIAHVDHGKSTLVDKLLERTGSIKKGHGQPQYLEKLQPTRFDRIALVTMRSQISLANCAIMDMNCVLPVNKQNQCPTCRQELGDGKAPLEASGIAMCVMQTLRNNKMELRM